MLEHIHAIAWSSIHRSSMEQGGLSRTPDKAKPWTRAYGSSAGASFTSTSPAPGGGGSGVSQLDPERVRVGAGSPGWDGSGDCNERPREEELHSRGAPPTEKHRTGLHNHKPPGKRIPCPTLRAAELGYKYQKPTGTSFQTVSCFPPASSPAGGQPVGCHRARWMPCFRNKPGLYGRKLAAPHSSPYIRLACPPGTIRCLSALRLPRERWLRTRGVARISGSGSVRLLHLLFRLARCRTKGHKRAATLLLSLLDVPKDRVQVVMEPRRVPVPYASDPIDDRVVHGYVSRSSSGVQIIGAIRPWPAQTASISGRIVAFAR